MADLPFGTHRYLVESLAGGHMKIKLIKNYLGFIKRVRESPKYVLRQLYQLASRDVRTVTGSNLRNILMLTNTLKVDNLDPSLVNMIEYHKIKEDQKWRVDLMNELIGIKHGEIHTPEGWSKEDLVEILNYTCTL